jgi:uncharacterized glyoxalase superfamily protein PhnB
MTLGATLYVKNSLEAAAFYCDAFGMEIGYHAKRDDGTYLHAELEKNGNSVFAVSESDDPAVREATLAARRPTMSLGVNLDTDEELKRAFDALSRGGHVLRPLGSLPWSPSSADVVDTFGVCWYLYVSQHRPEEAE